MRSSKKKSKGISRSVLNTKKKVFTTEGSVLKFFQNHPDNAYSLDMLYQAGFYVNTGQILRKLVETHQIIQSSYYDEEIEEEEDLYSLARSKNTFIINKTDDGWIISKITINGFSFDLDCGFLSDKIQDSLAGNMIKVAIGFPSDGDGVIFTEIKDPDLNLTRKTSIRHSELMNKNHELSTQLTIYQKVNVPLGFEVESPAMQYDESADTRKIKGDIALLWNGDTGFLFIIDPKEYSVNIYPRYRDFNREDEDDEEDPDYFDINYGFTDVDENKEKTDTTDEKCETLDLVGFGDETYNFTFSDMVKDALFLNVKAKRD